MRIRNVTLESASDGFRLSCTVSCNVQPDKELWYEASGGVQPPSIEMAGAALLAATLQPTAYIGEDVQIEGTCDAHFLKVAPIIARATARLHWLPHRVNVEGEPDTSLFQPDRVVATSFSGGVDSFFTLKRHTEPGALDPVGALVTGLGLDVRIDFETKWNELKPWMESVSSELGLPHFWVRTNYKEVFDPIAHYSRISYGSCLASIGFALSGSVSTYLVPCSAPIDRLYAWGSNALLNNAYESSHTVIKDDGWDCHRNEKLPAIADWPLAMKKLRVCTRHVSTMNCGRCEKCTRTMALLMLHGKLENAETFAGKLTVERLRNHRLHRDAQIDWYRMMVGDATKSGLNGEVLAALKRVVRRSNLRVLRKNFLTTRKGPPLHSPLVYADTKPD